MCQNHIPKTIIIKTALVIYCKISPLKTYVQLSHDVLFNNKKMNLTIFIQWLFNLNPGIYLLSSSFILNDKLLFIITINS